MIKVAASRDKRISKKDILISINHHKIDDWLDFTFYNDANIKRKIQIKANGHLKTIMFKEMEQLNIELAEPSWHHCENTCEYCFINGLPPNSRKTLFFRDDDFRLSFLYGNFISMTNLTKADYQKIFTLRLSPLYVSVHSTNPVLRAKMFNNNVAADIMKQLKQLIERDITIHTQIVIQPGVNDGKELLRTINDLVSLYPGVASIGIVPIGRTYYNRYLKAVNRKLAHNIVDLSRKMNKQLRRRFNKGIVYASDEIFLTAGDRIPDCTYYDDMPQHENGIGMIRHFLDAINSWNGHGRIHKRMLVLTGSLAYPFISKMKQKMVDIGFLAPSDMKVCRVNNSFFGDSVTVAGLIGGHDFSNAIKKSKIQYDLVLLPPYCMNSEHRLIDDQKLPSGAVIASTDYRNFITWLQSL